MVVAKTFAQAHAAALKVSQVYAPAGGSQVPTATEVDESTKTVSEADLKHAIAFLENPAVRTRMGLKASAPKLHVNGVSHRESAPRAEANQKLSATFKTGGQYHFYMETQCTLAKPRNGDDFEISISDQWPSYSQQNLAAILGVSQHNINCVMSHAGGAFGGKIMRQIPLAAACAVAANKLRQPVLAQHDRLDDMRTVNGREPINFDYNVTFDSTGKVDAMDFKIDFFPGWFYGDAAGDSAMAKQFSDNCYHYNSYNATINPILTKTPHTTPMRAPGAMQSIIWSSVVMEHIAKTLGKSLEEVQQLNFYKVNDTTPFGDKIGADGYNWTIPTLWEQIQKDADYAARKQAVEKFNQENRWVKRGISLTPVKYMAGLDQYQCGATVCVYADGTVLVNHGGCEVGQGINTVASLCAAQTLGIPVEKVKVGTTETAKIANNTTTGGSGTTESVSAAVTSACQDIAERISKVKKPGMTWEEAVTQAITGERGVCMIATAWWQGPKTSNADTYSTYGVAAGEVQVDVLTGEVRVERVDILMDLGDQLDAAVDIGQLEGGFVQALGYILSEEVMYNSKGEKLTLGTWNYKIPGAYDIPLVFNCSLLKNSPNPVGVRRSKLCAEPCMSLCSSVYFAVKQAIYSARSDAGLGDDWFMLDLPITPQQVCMSIGTPLDKLQV
jgi:xanthine dehydrogenase/oxidase